MMDETTLSLTVFFEDPFWVGVFERVENDQLSVCRHVFGAEPTNAEVFTFIQQRFRKLEFSPTIAIDRQTHHSNPKRRQRTTRKATEARGIGSKAQQALAAQREASKDNRSASQRKAREASQAERYAKRRAKQKAKHRGH